MAGLIATGEREHLVSFYDSSGYVELMFLFFTLETVYAGITGMRIWKRVALADDGRVGATWFDWTFAIVAIPLTGIFLIIGILDIMHKDYIGTFFIGFSVVLLIIVFFDIWTFISKPSVKNFPWWLVHTFKMVGALAAIMYALYTHRYTALPEFLQFKYFGFIMPLTLILAAYLYYRKKYAPVLLEDRQETTN